MQRMKLGHGVEEWLEPLAPGLRSGISLKWIEVEPAWLGTWTERKSLQLSATLNVRSVETAQPSSGG
jgi:hypothetical protein